MRKIYFLITFFVILIAFNFSGCECDKILIDTAPILSSPTDGSIIDTNTPKLQWNSVPDATAYEVVVDNSNDFSSPEYNPQNVKNAQCTTTSLSPNKYYWKVRAISGPWSNVWNFTINTQNSLVIILYTPANGSTTYDNTPSFDWNEPSGATKYEIVVDNASNFSSPEIDQNNLISSNYTPSNALAAGTYFWHVRGQDNIGNWRDWSETWSFSIEIESATVYDIDGNIYHTIQIGNQTWMMENLKVTHYRNGEAIPNITDDTEWSNLTTGAYCNYDNNSGNVSTYGRLYNWYAATDSRNLAPAGWHVPTDAEWQALVDYLGGSSVAGGKLKEAGTSHWQSPNTGATNESGFTGLPGGYRNNSGPFSDNGLHAYFWTRTEYSSTHAWFRGLLYYDATVRQFYSMKKDGNSIRCVKDMGTPPVNPVISGYVLTSGGSGISGVTITFSNSGGTTTTNGSGYYSQTVSYGWSGTVTPSLDTYTFNPTNRNYSNVTSNQYGDFTGYPPSNPVISGYIRTSGGTGIAGVSLTFSNSGGTTTTNGSGYYSQTIVYGWSGTVTPSLSGYSFIPTSRTYSTLTNNQSNQDYTGSENATGTVTDIDGNTYQTIKIGNQWWMAENLKVTHYRNGEAIPNITDDTEWSNLTTGAYCNYDNNSGNVSTYGRLYNWYAATDSRNLAPAGWHVPTDAEWQALVDYLGGSSVAGGKLKEAGTSHWQSPNTGATNESGFTGLPGGYRNNSGPFSDNGLHAYFWTRTEYSSTHAWFRGLLYYDATVRQFYSMKKDGNSIRCVKD